GVRGKLLQFGVSESPPPRERGEVTPIAWRVVWVQVVLLLQYLAELFADDALLGLGLTGSFQDLLAGLELDQFADLVELQHNILVLHRLLERIFELLADVFRQAGRSGQRRKIAHREIVLLAGER